MENPIFLLFKRTQNLQAKYCEQILDLNQEIEKLQKDLLKAQQSYNKKRKRNKEQDSQSKEEYEELQQMYANIEKLCDESNSNSFSSSSSSSSSSDSSSSSSNSTSSNYSISSCRSTSSGSRLSSNIDISENNISCSTKTIEYEEEENYITNSSTDGKNIKKKDNSNTHPNLLMNSPRNPPIPEINGVFEYLFYKFNKNPIDLNLIQISGNSFDEYEHELLPNIVDPRWKHNHWMSENTANSSITINFLGFSIKINKYRIRVGCSNGLGRFNSWDLEATTKDKKKVILDKVLNSSQVSQNNPEITVSIQNDLFVNSIKIMMRGKNTDNNYKMRFRNIEIFGKIRIDK